MRHRVCPVWLKTILLELAAKKNCRFDHMQLTQYGVGDHYNTWHTDAEENGLDPEDARVLTFIIMLLPCTKCGDLQFLDDNRVQSISLSQGDIVIFDSRVAMHMVVFVVIGACY